MKKDVYHYLDCILLVAGLFVIGYTFADPSSQSTVENPDGSFTYSQKISAVSTAPHYVAPSGYGFDEYSWYNEDYGWQHNFDLFNNNDYQIQSASLLIRGWDVDSEPVHGTNGEYDGIFVDGVALNPGLLQGTNNTWSETEFTVPLQSISDDGLINVFLDIDMNHTSRTWATTLDYSLLTITYIQTTNNPPSQPQISVTPSSSVSVDDDLVVTITGPVPADPDNDSVNYSYRWFVDVGQGFYVDDEFAGKNNHSGNTVPASQTAAGERWKVEVYPSDSNGIAGLKAVGAWFTIGDSDDDGVPDNLDAYPLDSQRAFINSTPSSGMYTLAYEDLWPIKGDYDLNDLVLHYAFDVITNASNQVKQITMNAELVSRGASRANGFAISFAGTTNANVETNSLTIANQGQLISPESGHNSALVYVLVNNLNNTLPPSGSFSFYNTEIGDQRAAVPMTFSVSFTNAIHPASLGPAPFNPFIFATFERGIEIHLPDKPPTALANTGMLGQSDDSSSPASGRYYRTSTNLPWAMNISKKWLHPLERIDVLQAYPTMENWAESGGLNSIKWYNNPVSAKCWTCQ
jgi:LruC domain-containing protein